MSCRVLEPEPPDCESATLSGFGDPATEDQYTAVAYSDEHSSLSEDEVTKGLEFWSLDPKDPEDRARWRYFVLSRDLEVEFNGKRGTADAGTAVCRNLAVYFYETRSEGTKPGESVDVIDASSFSDVAPENKLGRRDAFRAVIDRMRNNGKADAVVAYLEHPTDEERCYAREPVDIDPLIDPESTFGASGSASFEGTTKVDMEFDARVGSHGVSLEAHCVPALMDATQ